MCEAGNPFSSPDATFVVLRNDEGRYALWPARMPIPTGWWSVRDEAGRDDCLAYVAEVWTDPCVPERAPSS